MKYILNSAVITGPGDYRYRLIDAATARLWSVYEETGVGGHVEAKTLVAVSTVGYEQTADALGQLLGVPVPVDRRTITMQAGDEALVFRLVFPSGTPRIDPADKGRLAAAVMAGQYELGLLTRLA